MYHLLSITNFFLHLSLARCGCSSTSTTVKGVFLAADLAFDRIKHNQFVDLVALVQSLRRQRFNLVASPKDYQFTTQLLADIVKDGNTEIGARNLALHCQRLASCQPGKTDNWSNVNEKLLTGFQVEFAKIESTSPQLAASCPGQAIITSPQSNRRLYSNNVGDGSECSTFQCNPHASVESSKTVLTGNASCRDALMPANQVKNRFRHSIPFDFNRIRLASLRGVLGSDYINASLVDGYQRRGFFIACQSPVGGGGVDDFWRMIWQEDSRVIVTLDQLNESSSGEEFDCVRYWPSTDKRSLRFNYFVIDRLKCSDDETDSSLAHRRGNKGALVVVCDLRVTDTRDGQWRPIRQIQLDWRCEYNDKSASLVVSSDTRAQLINLVGQTHKAWARVKSHGPITVHCSSGSDRTGIFIALSNVLERLRQESVVDMYQTVKMLRFQRLGMVGSVDQYRLCYAVALDYLASFDLCSVQQDRDRMMNGHRDLGDRIDAISTHSSSSASVGNSSTGACSTVFNNATSSSAQLDRRLILGGIDDQ